MFNSAICGIFLLALPVAAATGRGPVSPAGKAIQWISVSPQATYVAAHIGCADSYQSRLLVLDSSGHRVSEAHLIQLEKVAEGGVPCTAWAPDESALFAASGGGKATEGELLMLSLPAGRTEKVADLPSALNFSGLHALSSEAVLCTLAGHIRRKTPAGLYLFEKSNGKWRTEPLWVERSMAVRCLWSVPDRDGYRLLLVDLAWGKVAYMVSLLTARLQAGRLSDRKEHVRQSFPLTRVVGASPGGELVAVLSPFAAELVLYGVGQGQWGKRSVSLPRSTDSLAFSPDGKKLALWVNSHRVRPERKGRSEKILILDTQSLQIKELELPRRDVAGAGWLSRDALLVATDTAIVKLNVESGDAAEFLPALPPPEGAAAQAFDQTPVAPAPDQGPVSKPLSGGFGPARLITRRILGLRSIYAADLDGDGDADLLSASEEDDKVAWYENIGDGDFGEQKLIAGGLLPVSITAPGSVRAADLDGDGDWDVVVASQGRWDSSTSAHQGGIWWYENLGGGHFSSEQPIATGINWARDVHAADLDGDGDDDVLFASVYEDKIAWCENLGGGRFKPAAALTTEAHRAASVSAADLDGDGDQDVLSGSFLKVSWYENMGGGRFGPQRSVTRRVKWVHAVQTADLDGDGTPDVLACSIWAVGPAPTVAWYQNMGGGAFGPEQLITEYAGAFHVADLDRDGDPDVISSTDKGLGWFENTGGSLEPLQVIAPELPSLVHATDIDGDGDADVFAAVGEGERIVWYENLIGMDPSE